MVRPVFAILLCLLLLPLLALAGDDIHPPPPEALRNKTLILNSAVAGGILLWGTLNWNYFETTPDASNEEWFGQDAKEGGVDKLGHLYIAHIASQAFRSIYLDWGYSEEQAGSLGVLSSLGMTTLMEVGDSFSQDYGFSYEDMLMNLAGAGLSYLMIRFPKLDSKIDLRLEYKPSLNKDFEPDFFTDYQHQKYLLAIKAEGFTAIRNTWLKALELHLGYYARNYDGYQAAGLDRRRRTIYVGLGFNVGRLLRQWVKTPVFDYLQLPYTYLPLERHLD